MAATQVGALRSGALSWCVLALLWILCSVNLTDGLQSPSTLLNIRRERNIRGPVAVEASGYGGGSGQSAGTSGEERLERSKRDAGPKDASTRDAAQPEAVVFQLNDSHPMLIIDWAGEGSNVIFCMTQDPSRHEGGTSLYVSRDYGKSFNNITDRFALNSHKPATINKMYENVKFISRFVFTDVTNNYLFVSDDFGQTIHSHKVKFHPSEVSFHPQYAQVILAYDSQDPEKKLWLSEDHGEEWRLVEMMVKTYYWSEATSPPTLYVVREDPEGESVVLGSKELYREGTTPERIITGVEEFQVMDDFLFAIKKVRLLGSSSTDGTLQLWVSYKGGPFMLAQFPNTLTHLHYYIADISEGQIMICVAHDKVMSNLYVSSVPRSANHQVEFSLSLERILYFNPSTNWEDTWLSQVRSDTFADLHPVQGIRGVFIASQLIEDYPRDSGNLLLEHLSSLITFNQGAQWKPLQPPRRDAAGNTVTCERKNNCSLHVSQELSFLYPETRTVPIFSKKSAPGLVLATGTVGTSLKGHPSLYVSTDAGINWYEVMKGNYIYTFGDHGGVIVAVLMYKLWGETNELRYSTDDGETWQTFQFYPEKLRIFSLLTEPGENSTVFTLFGSKPEKHEWIIIQVNMTNIFKYECKSEDYKPWSPSDGRSGRHCLLGHKEVFERRIPHSNCFSGLDYDRPISVENCPCSREDFECDYGFRDDTGTQECVVDRDFSGDPHTIPLTCKPGQFYNRTKGYRKIPGDSCEGGREYQYLPAVTACPVSKEQEFLLVSIRSQVYRYNLVDPEAGMTALPIPNLSTVIALDFDLANNCIYWSDAHVDNRGIKRLCFDGRSDVEILVDTEIHSVEGMALDWVSNNLYFVDGALKTLEVVRTDMHNFGRMRRTLLTDSTLDNPRGIAVHPVQGYLFLTDWSETEPKIARTYLDASNWQVLFGKDVVGWPNGITIDFQTDRIFFVDAKLDYIASADLDGKNFKKIISDNDKVMQPFAVGVYKSELFWDDWQVHRVLRANKDYGWGITPIPNFTRIGLVDLKVFGHWSQQGSNACSNNSSSCTHLCMGLPSNEYACLCPNGMQTHKQGSHSEQCSCPDGSPVDEHDGTCKATGNTCSQNFFMCDSGRCIPKQWVCDADNDCGDSSDENEKNCGQRSCEPPSWQCANGHCIAQNWRCDYDDDCGDHSDEDGCHFQECPETTFRCNNGRCIDKNWRCDLEDDCRDGSDEVNCTSTTTKPQCTGTDFTCVSDGRCLPNSWRCDGDKDCSDNSDEDQCNKYSCEPWQFQCDNKQCIFRSWQCDGESDCHDGSDEKECKNVTTTTPIPTEEPISGKNCTALMFRCQNTHCIPFWWRCDGLDDCGDASDEDGCGSPFGGRNVTTPKPATTSPKPTCSLDQFQCNDGACIWETWVCDTDQDCLGGEDEENCHHPSSCTAPGEFQCIHSGGCISSALICDAKRDCADGSDEEGCSALHNATSSCPDGFFMCDGGACQENFRRCDGNHDCLDMKDEQDCTANKEQAYLVTDIVVAQEANTSAVVRWLLNEKQQNKTQTNHVEFLPSLIIKAAFGNPNAWANWTWTSQMTYNFTGLEPYTEYVVKVYTRQINTTHVFPPITSKTFTTQQGVPSPPVDVLAAQRGNVIVVTWRPPLHPNGPVQNYQLFVSPPNPATGLLVPGNNTAVAIHLLENKLLIWLTVTNEFYTSGPSEKVVFDPLVVDKLVNLTAKPMNASVVELRWEALGGVEGYTVSRNQPENEFMFGNVEQTTSQNTLEVSGLAPGQRYIFEVTPYKGKVRGPPSTVAVTMPGERLSPVQALQAQVMEDFNTTVKLTWTPPNYKMQKISWNYRVIWGRSASEMKSGANVKVVSNTSLVLEHLDACEVYEIGVMPVGYLGTGPATVKQVETRADPLAPPKTLRALRTGQTNKTIVVTWEPSCPQEPNLALRYLLSVTETTFNKTSYFELPSRNTTIQSHTIESHWGGRYLVSIQTSRRGARPTNGVPVNGPTIQPPYELTYNPSDTSFFWKRDRNLPHEILTQNFSYVLYISENLNMSEAMAYPCGVPPLVLNELAPGVVFYAAVALRDAEGYLSPKSQAIRLERSIGNGIVLSNTSVVGVGVSVFLVVAALVAIIGVLAVRHRRLARSFLSFANTHYDRSQGTTLITTDHSLDEDDDSPMIRGFSDDEPLVIA